MLSVQVLLAIFYLLLLSWVILRSTWFRIEGLNPKLLLGAFYLKLLFGILFWAVYTFYYGEDHGSDAFAYFAEGQILHQVFWDNPAHFFRLLFTTNPSDPELQQYILEMDRWNRAVSYGVLNDNPTIIKFNAMVMFLSLGLYHTHTLFMTFVCFSGLILMLRFFKGWLPKLHPIWILFAVILPPSLLFWSGGVMKEGILLFGLGLLLFGVHSIRQNHMAIGYLWIIAAIFFLLFTKAYVLIAFSPGILFLLFIHYTGMRRWLLKFTGLHLGLFTAVFSLGLWFKDYNVFHMFQLKQKDFYNLGQPGEIGSLIEIPPLNHWTDIILNTPTALFNTYFRPHIFETNSIFFLVSAIENLFYLILLVTALIMFKKPTKSELALALMCLSCLVGLGMLVGLITPVLGAIVRYKIPALPFLLMLCFILMLPRLTSLTSRLQSLSHKTNKKP